MMEDLSQPAVRPIPPPASQQGDRDQSASAPEDYFPRPPRTLQETGLPASMIEHLVLKTVYFQGEVIGRDIAELLGLQFSLIAPLVELLRRRRLLEIKGSLGFGDISAVFALSETGRARARECLEDNQYVGRAPVPISDYAGAVRRQRPAAGWLTKEQLRAAYSHLVLAPETLDFLGPAISAGRSLLVYGRPGNGKTFLARTLASLEGAAIFLPYAIECNGLIVKLYDPLHHQRLDGPDEWRTAQYDGRWARCRRPFIFTGGELTLNMLDLGFNPVARIYDAPFQLKANNGIYLIDDFGRQRATPAEVLNRWIVPMERGVDYLAFPSGIKVEVPFQVLLVFSTNLRPEDLGDEAFLRRIDYKLLLKNPDSTEFAAILEHVCATEKLDCPSALIARFIESHYLHTGRPFRRCHPRDIVSHVVDFLSFHRLPPVVTEDVLDRAFQSCMVELGEREET